MKKIYFIGIDIGTQSSKVAIFDQFGTLICESSKAFQPLSYPKPGFVEHPDDDLWDTLKAASMKTMDMFVHDHGLNKNDIAAAGLCVVRSSRSLLKKDGSLANPVICWMDTRIAKPYQHDIKDVGYVTSTSGYITHRLTGQFNDTAAYYDKFTQWPLDQKTWQWSDDESIIQHYNLPKDMLFNLVMPSDLLGHVTKDAAKETGLPENLPIVATANDKAVEGLGSGIINQNSMLVSLGTYITSMIHCPNYQQDDGKNYWVNLASMPNQYLYESGGIRRGMWTISWFLDNFSKNFDAQARAKNMSIIDYCNKQAAKIPAGSDGLITVLDWLAPVDQPYKKGAFIGFDYRHNGLHIYRSILEAIAFKIKNNSVDMCEELSVMPNNIIISGGGSNSDLMMQIFADIYGLSVHRNMINSAASLGSAINAAVGIKFYDDFKDAVKNMVHIKDSFTPNQKNTNLYQRMNDQVIQNIPTYLDQILTRLHNII